MCQVTIINTLDIAVNKTDKSLPDVFGFKEGLSVDLRGSNNTWHCKKNCFCCLYVNDRARSFHQILKEDDD